MGSASAVALNPGNDAGFSPDVEERRFSAA
jgi:hypothetical protein